MIAKIVQILLIPVNEKLYIIYQKKGKIHELEMILKIMFIIMIDSEPESLSLINVVRFCQICSSDT